MLGTKVGRVLCAHAPSDSSRHAAGRAIFADATPLVPVFDFSYDAARRSLDESLTRLGLDRVDIVHIHDPDDFIDEALGGAYRALAGLRRDGVITAVSVGVTSAEVALRFVRDADLDCVLLARRYTLLDQSALGALLPLCAARGIGVIVGGVYHSGLLAAPAHGTMFDYAPAEPDAVARVQRLDAVCREYHVPLNAAAIQFPFGHPAVTSVVVGCHSASELDDNLAALRHPIPAELWTRLKREGVIVTECAGPGIAEDGRGAARARGWVPRRSMSAVCRVGGARELTVEWPR